MIKTKIIIAGIGGVGGYFGGLLAKHFANSEDVEINFIARGKHLEEIKAHGLKVIKGTTEFIAKPHIATDDPSQIGMADFIIICTKSYDLEAAVQQLQPCISKNTIILPLLNGVDSRQRILSILPDTIVLDGCAYIVSRLKQPGVIENSGNVQTLFFGPDTFAPEKVQLLENIFKQAGVEATLSQNISTIIWEKFIFISPTATATSYYNNTIGQLLADPEKYKTVQALIEEVKLVAAAKQIAVATDITEKTVKRLHALPFETTSSMHSDYQNKKPHTELESLTQYVINEGKKYGVATPVYDWLIGGMVVGC